jgi:hypothetical protein
VIELLKASVVLGILNSDIAPAELLRLLDYHRETWWKVTVSQRKNKESALNYYARYLRRPPIGDSRIISFNASFVRFFYKDKKNENEKCERVLSTLLRLRPCRLSWAVSCRETFGMDPLLDCRGMRLRWSYRLPPCPQVASGFS